jgi:hypothetical protein
MPPAAPASAAGRAALAPSGVRRARRRAVDASIRKITSNPAGRGKIRAFSGCFFVVGVGLAAVAIVVAARELVAGALENALGTFPGLALAALLAGVGWWIRSAAYHDVWQFNQHERIVTHLRRRLRDETVEEEFPFEEVTAVMLTKSSGDDFLYSVDLALTSGRTVFVSHDRSHAAELATLLGVPKREG